MVKRVRYLTEELFAKIARRIKMSKLNEEQMKAVDHFYGPCLVSACPGAGKTRVITTRAIRLVKKGISPHRILLVTFTNKAAREMRERIEKSANDEGVSSFGMTVSTFHSTCLDIMRRSLSFSLDYKRANILDDDDVESVLKSVAEDHHVSMEKEDLQSFKYAYSSLREKALTKDEIKEELAKINQDYILLMDLFDQSMSNMNALDFSGIMYIFWQELMSNAAFKTEVQNMFVFAMLDIIQFEIAKIICALHNNLFMVGDTDQSIYQWRGANPSQVSQFVRSGECSVYRLTKNYRCSGNITRIASSLISFNPGRLNSDILAHREMGDPVKFSVFSTREEEADSIAKNIVRLKASGVKMKDVAILIRASHLTRGIEQALMRNSISYHMTGGFRFYDREEVKDVVSMLKFVHNPKDVISFSRFMNKPRRGLGGKCVQAIGASSLRSGITNGLQQYLSQSDDMKDSNKNAILRLIENIFSKPLKTMPLKALTEHLVEATSYKTYLDTFKGDIPQDKLENIQELIKSIEISNQSLGEFLTSVSLMSTPKEENEEDIINSVKIMTMHGAKGLEFENVFLPCFEENILPHRRSLEGDPKGVEEERRLAYVAITRAMNRLWISAAMFSGGGDRSMKLPSRFIFESGLCDKEGYYELAQEARNIYMA